MLFSNAKLLLGLVLLFTVAPSLQGQQVRTTERDLFRNCWREGIILQQPACIAHIYLQRVEGILEIARSPEVKISGNNARAVQELLTDMIYRQQQKARRYRETCNDLRTATKGGDSIARTSTDVICGAFEFQETADSIQLAAVFEEIQPTNLSVVDRAKTNAKAASISKDASNGVYLSSAAVTYMLLDQNGLGMSKAERQALITQSFRVYRGEKVQKARFVLEQAVEQIRTFLQDSFKDRG